MMPAPESGPTSQAINTSTQDAQLNSGPPSDSSRFKFVDAIKPT